MTRPIVTASCNRAPAARRLVSGEEYSTPGVRVEVTFDLHDHKAALALLEDAAEDVRAQIEETRP